MGLDSLTPNSTAWPTWWWPTDTAGDGYLASNQRRLVFGLGACELIDELVVHWPSGARQTWRNVSVDRELILVEERDELTEAPK
ncbi:MAG TPA: ASPIC/UnbV domain-containing protein [Pirellulales bacterium]|nr:ASPIC/UnbV domain-containing protein [Pirellulales bacterium]